jgi:hypothetical protein
MALHLLLLPLLLQTPVAVEWPLDQQLHLLPCALHHWFRHMAHRT